MSKIIAYMRVRHNDQNITMHFNKLKKMGIQERFIFQDIESEGVIEKIGYKYMKQFLERGDILVIEKLSCIGKNQIELKKEWEYFRDNEISVRVLDVDALNIDYTDEKIKPMIKIINNIILEIMSWKIENNSEKAISKNNKRGRPKVEITENFKNEVKRWRAGEITATQAMKNANVKRTSFYKLIKEL